MSARGVPEYTFNLRLAKAVEQSLTEAGFSRATLLITTGKTRAGLASRVANANGLPADLFLSIHHDSVPKQFKAKWDYEGKEHAYCDRFPGHSIFISNDNINRAGSLEFARLLGTQLKARGLTYTPHYTEAFMGSRRRQLVDAEAGVYRYDQLIVLRRTLMPAALLEAGSIVNRDEEVVLASPEREALVGAAVTQAVEAFCAARATRVADGARRPPAIQAAAARPTASPQQATSVRRR
jgi:N-acetylmuramoyl-L-alanine amidase